MDSYADGKTVFFQKRSFKDVVLNTYFLALIDYTKEHDNQLNPALFEKFIKRLLTHSTLMDSTTEFSFTSNWEKAVTFINMNLKDSISLETLANHCEMDKYKFAKSFKYFCGMSPMNYVLMQRIFSAKETIANDTNLTNVAYEYNFTDLAHFSKQFKRFVGLSPRNYQKHLKK
jgi:AraC-like DNA-binding protein